MSDNLDIKNLAQEMAKTNRRIDQLQKDLDLLNDDRKILENIEARLSSIETRLSSSRANDDQARKDIKEEINKVDTKVEITANTILDSLRKKKIIRVKPKPFNWKFWERGGK